MPTEKLKIRVGYLMITSLLLSIGMIRSMYSSARTFQEERAQQATSPGASGSTTITIVAYGDTRTGVWGLGDNVHQRIHAHVVNDMICRIRATRIDGVVFTGDAVMTNFPAWKKKYWESFLKQTDKLVRPPTSSPTDHGGDPSCALAETTFFYPTYGNHETYEDVPFLLEAIAKKSTSPAPGIVPATRTPESAEEQISEAYDDGENSYAKAKSSKGFVPSMEHTYTEAELLVLKARVDTMEEQTLKEKERDRSTSRSI